MLKTIDGNYRCLDALRQRIRQGSLAGEIEFRRLPRDGSARISGEHLADRARLSENSSSRKLPWWGTSFHLCPWYRWHYLLPLNAYKAACQYENRKQLR
jgi:hypothetical protein